MRKLAEILFLAHRMPFPPDRGDKIRSYHVLNALAAIAPVHVATFAENERDLSHEGHLAGIAKSHCLVTRDKPLWRAGVEALFSGKPVSLAAFHDVRLQDYVRKVIAERRIGAIYVFSGQMGQYVPDDYSGRVLVDLVDVDSAKFEAYAQAGFRPRRWIDAREGRLLAIEEGRLARRAHETLLVSEAEAELFKSRLGDAEGARVSVLGNGIDSGFFDPVLSQPAPALAYARGPHIVFTGQMDYAPNAAAALRLMQNILPRIRAVQPQAQCHIVGRNPGAALLAHDRHGGCRVWGAVEDIRPFIAAADIVAAPLAIARGVQNKVLEAMAMARPVLLTPEAATGIGGEDGVHFAVADTDEALARRALEMLEAPEAMTAMGRAAREYVVRNRSWQTMLCRLPELLGRKPAEPERRHVA
ncbi:MAG: TIGR03087 family PEP-CTERM/XrtA system glycosyltransferase [Novosphingobium sp.]